MRRGEKRRADKIRMERRAMNNISREQALKLLNAPNRLDNLRSLVLDAREGRLPMPVQGEDVNNHIHTTYSFSPYSPTAAAWFAWQAGLCTCGLMDHDSIAGAREFLSACHILGMGATIGLECRVSMKDTPFESRKTNNPDQAGVSYITLHGVPHNRAGELNEFFAPYRAARNQRNRKMVEAINSLMGQYGISLDFDRDVIPLSNYAGGGTVTERHLSCALANQLIEKVGKGERLVSFIHERLELPLSGKVESYLLDEENPYLTYDLLGWIKSQLISRFYIDATDECPGIRQVLSLAQRIGAICAYPYLGDVGDSVTGDKRAQKFEDDFLDELVDCLYSLGFRAITYMPSRNTRAQLDRLRALCEKYSLFQISGEDINSPRQSFVCAAQRDAAFRNLYYGTWALIAHEWRATENPDDGLFSQKSAEKWPDLNERVMAFAEMGMAMER